MVLQLKMNFFKLTILNVCQLSALAFKPKWYVKRILRKLHLIQKVLFQNSFRLSTQRENCKWMHSFSLSLTISTTTKLTHEKLNSGGQHQGLNSVHLQTPSQKFYFLIQNALLQSHTPLLIVSTQTHLLSVVHTQTPKKKKFPKVIWG